MREALRARRDLWISILLFHGQPHGGGKIRPYSVVFPRISK
jgi:hypothetical protein